MSAISNPLSMFISYSHQDKKYLDDLQKHLATLRHKGILHEWTDKELVAGDHLVSEIETHLRDADLVAFLISSDFIASWSCFHVELEKTLERMDSGKVRIIPIIVRSCNWKDTVLSSYLAATDDGKPVSKYSDNDDAWVEVVNSIEKAAEKYIKSKTIGEANPTLENKAHPRLNPRFSKKLKETEVVFQHKCKEHLVLDDIYVYPDLKNIKQEYDEIEKTLNSGNLNIHGVLPTKLLILGSEQSGKTSLAKMLFDRYYGDGHLPLFCDGRDIKTADITQLLGKLVLEQYSGYTLEEYLASQKKKILIVDDFDKIKLNLRYQKQCLERALGLTNTLILFSDTAIKYDEQHFLELSDYIQYEILPLGNLRRGELIEKWNSLGREETIDLKELHHANDNVTHHVNSVIRKNILPPKPIYVLTVIQLLDTATPTDYSLTSYGHCYQSLIQAALKKTKIKASDFDLYINYLSEIAFAIFNTGTEYIDGKDMGTFKSQYAQKYLINSHEEVISVLLESGILRKQDEQITFSYRYIFYFYVAKYLADHVDVDDCKKQIRQLCKNIHTEKNANVLIFIVHHTKDQGIIDEILQNASVVFEKTNEARLDVEDTKYLLEYIASIPKLVIEQRNIDDERKKRLKAKDDNEKNKEPDDLDSEANDESKSDVFAEINRSVRFVEIIGQILRNRHGSLTKNQLTELSRTAYSSGLKFLNFFLTATREGQEHILKFIQDIFRKNTDLSDDGISKEARKIFLILCYGTSYSVIKKIANSVGSEKLMPIFESIGIKNPNSPAIRLINISIQLEFTKTIPKKAIEEAFIEFKSNPITQRLLQEIVIQHLYLNHVEYKDRQWISNKLNLPMKSQRLLQSKMEHKK